MDPETKPERSHPAKKESTKDKLARYGMGVADKLATAALVVCGIILYNRVTRPKTQA